MELSRRELGALVAATKAVAQDAQLHSAGYEFGSLPEHRSANGKTTARSVFRGITSHGQRLTMHITELAPGEAPHPPERTGARRRSQATRR